MNWWLFGQIAMAAPALVPVQGYLTDAAGAPLEGTTTLTFRLYNAGSGALAWEDDVAALTEGGRFSAVLGAGAALDLAIFHGANLALSVEVPGLGESEPAALGAVPYAASAQRANTADTLGTLRPEDVLTTTNAAATYLTQSSANANFLKQSDAASTYAPLTALGSYLTTAIAGSTYLSQANAASTYLSQANAASTYLSQANAASTYLSQANAATTYLTQTNAAGTYLTQTNANTLYTNAANLSSGTIPFARLPTGTTSSTVAVGNHTHTPRITVARYQSEEGVDYTTSWANTGYGSFSVTKQTASSKLKITWTDSIRTIDTQNNGGVCMWKYLLNGAACSPGELTLWQHDTGSSPSADKHMPHSTTMICEGVAAGTVNFVMQARRRDGDEDCYHGYSGQVHGGPFTATVIVEELEY